VAIRAERRGSVAAVTLIAATGALGGAVGLVAVSQDRLPAGQSLFRAGADLVAVDFLAVDASGRPVADLTAKDLTLKVDGRVREIRAFQFVKVSPTGAEAPVPVAALGPAYGTNDAAVPGRVVILVIDRDEIRPADGKPVFDAAARFLDRLAPIDRAGVLTLPNGEVEADLTTNHERVRRVLSRIVGQFTRPTAPWTVSAFEAVAIKDESRKRERPVTEEVVTRECGLDSAGCAGPLLAAAIRLANEIELKTRASIAALRTFFDGLARVEGPKTVLFVSAALVSTAATPVDFNDLARAAARGRAQLYVIQPHQPLVEAGSRGSSVLVKDFDLRRDGLRDFAARTGGVFFQLSGPGDNVLARIADEISAYYVLGFTPQSPERDGKPHRIELQTARREVTLRARPSFVIGAPVPASPELQQPATMLGDFAVHADLPLRVTAYPFRHTDKTSAKILVALETTESAATLTAAAFAIIDVKGGVAAEWTEEGVNVVLRPVMTAVAVPPGEYRLRAAALDTRGRRGAVDYEFDAALTKMGALEAGALMLGTLERDTFKPRMLTDARTGDLSGYLELYGTPAGGQRVSVMLELAARPDDPPLVSATAEVQRSSDPDRFIVTGFLPLAGIAAGDYVARAVVRLDGHVIGRVVRAVRKAG
jgi:VWFA-related protein